MSRQMIKHVVPADGKPHEIEIGAGEFRPLAVQLCAMQVPGNPGIGQYGIVVYAEADMDAPMTTAVFRTLVTGQDIPDGACHVGTPPRSREGWVWHLYRLAPAAKQNKGREPEHCSAHLERRSDCVDCERANA